MVEWLISFSLLESELSKQGLESRGTARSAVQPPVDKPQIAEGAIHQLPNKPHNPGEATQPPIDKPPAQVGSSPGLGSTSPTGSDEKEKPVSKAEAVAEVKKLAKTDDINDFMHLSQAELDAMNKLPPDQQVTALVNFVGKFQAEVDRRNGEPTAVGTDIKPADVKIANPATAKNSKGMVFKDIVGLSAVAQAALSDIWEFPQVMDQVIADFVKDVKTK